MKKFLTILVCFTFLFGLSGCKKKDNLVELSKNLSHYQIDLDIDCENKKVKATQTLKYVNNTNSIIKNIKFHLYPQFFKEGATEFIVPQTKMNNAYPNGMSYANFNIERVKVNSLEQSVVYEEKFNSILNVSLNSSLTPNNSVDIYFEYYFTLPNCNHRFGYGDNTINIANFYPIACVYENDQFNTNGYHSNGDPFYSDMANYCVNIEIDQQYIVAASGNKIEEKNQNNKNTFSFKANMIRDFAIVASKNFNAINASYKDVKIQYFYFNDSEPNTSLQAGIDAIKTFSNLFGEYPYSTLSIVETDFMYGGMEFPNLIMISSNIENKEDYLNVIIHETAHQWWYGIVGNDEYKYPWLDEALTEFSTILFYDYNENYALNHKDMINISKENYSLFISVYEDVLGQIDTSMRAVNKYNTEPEYTYCIYIKGVLMFESLYQLVGEKEFLNSLKTYFENNKYTNTTPEDLIESYNQTCKQDFTSFFSSWINGKVVIR